MEHMPHPHGTSGSTASMQWWVARTSRMFCLLNQLKGEPLCHADSLARAEYTTQKYQIIQHLKINNDSESSVSEYHLLGLLSRFLVTDSSYLELFYNLGHSSHQFLQYFILYQL